MRRFSLLVLLLSACTIGIDPCPGAGDCTATVDVYPCVVVQLPGDTFAQCDAGDAGDGTDQ